MTVFYSLKGCPHFHHFAIITNSGEAPALFNISVRFRPPELFSDCGIDSAGHDAGHVASILRFQQGIPDRSMDNIRNERVPFLLMADTR